MIKHQKPQGCSLSPVILVLCRGFASLDDSPVITFSTD
jgi:hypothetical protein